MRPWAIGAACAALGVMLPNCYAESRSVRGPDGERWHAIDCRRSQTNCYEKAGEVCPHGYDVADEGGHSGTVLVANQYGAYAVPHYRGHMLIKCKRRGAPAAPENEVSRANQPSPATPPVEQPSTGPAGGDADGARAASDGGIVTQVVTPGEPTPDAGPDPRAPQGGYKFEQ
jgi:hypothetical protein